MQGDSLPTNMIKKTPLKELNIKSATARYNVKLNELRRKMHNDNPIENPNINDFDLKAKLNEGFSIRIHKYKYHI